MKGWIFILCLLFPTLNLWAEDKVYECNQHSELYKILSQEDDKHRFLNHKPEKDILADRKAREALSDAYAGIMSRNGEQYTIVGVKTVLKGKETTAYYLAKLDAKLMISSGQKPYYEIQGQFLGFSDDDEFLKKELSFLPFTYVNTKDQKEISVSLMQLKGEKKLYENKEHEVSLSAFAVANILGHTVFEFESQSKEKHLNLADVKIGFRIEKGEHFAFSVYAGKSLGYVVSAHHGVVPHVTSSVAGADVEWKHSKNISTHFIYEKRKMNTSSGHKDVEVIGLSLNIKFRGFEYIYEDFVKMLRRL